MQVKLAVTKINRKSKDKGRITFVVRPSCLSQCKKAGCVGTFLRECLFGQIFVVHLFVWLSPMEGGNIADIVWKRTTEY